MRRIVYDPFHRHLKLSPKDIVLDCGLLLMWVAQSTGDANPYDVIREAFTGRLLPGPEFIGHHMEIDALEPNARFPIARVNLPSYYYYQYLYGTFAVLHLRLNVTSTYTAIGGPWLPKREEYL